METIQRWLQEDPSYSTLPPSLAGLPLEVWIHIINICDRKDLQAFMLTCHGALGLVAQYAKKNTLPRFCRYSRLQTIQQHIEELLPDLLRDGWTVTVYCEFSHNSTSNKKNLVITEGYLKIITDNSYSYSGSSKEAVKVTEVCGTNTRLSAFNGIHHIVLINRLDCTGLKHIQGPVGKCVYYHLDEHGLERLKPFRGPAYNLILK